MQVALYNNTSGFIEIAELPFTSFDHVSSPFLAQSVAVFGDSAMPVFSELVDTPTVAVTDFKLLFTSMNLNGNVLEFERVQIDLSELDFQAVPEPATLTLLALGGVAVILSKSKL